VEFLEAQRDGVFEPAPGGLLDQIMRTKRPAQVPDLAATKPYFERHPIAVEAVELGGIRTAVAVPMLKDDQLIGIITIVRQEVCPFNDKQIELVKNFAAQAVVAIENARLLNELRQSLEQQTATLEVLQVISSSPGDLQPVFQAMLENATRICDAKFGTLQLLEGDGFRAVALHNAPPAFADYVRRGLLHPGPDVPLSRMARTKQVVHIADITMEKAYIERDPLIVAGADLGGYRTILVVPMLKESELLGGFVIFRQEVRLFTDKQIELVQNFAAQAVIAIENARLLNELRQRTTDLTERTADLTEALEQQTATSEVLSVISSSQGDLERVFDSLLENATRLCRAKFGNLYLSTEDGFRYVAMHGVPSEYEEMARQLPRGVVAQHPRAPLSRMARSKKVVHVPDLMVDEGYTKHDPRIVALVETAGARTIVVVPMLKDDELVGAIAIYRQEVQPFADEQINLLQNFAAQAVIAIENARLLNELRQRTTDLTERTADLSEALEQQTATSEVLQVISSSPGNLEPVFATMLEKAVRFCDAKFGNLYLYNEGKPRLVASHGVPEFLNARGNNPFDPAPGSLLDATIRTKRTLHEPDLAATQSYAERQPRTVEVVELAKARTVVTAPMLREDDLVGVIGVFRQEVRPFSDKQIALLQNFAAQAAIAIENTRLLNELRERTEQVEAQSKEVVKLNQQLEQRVADQVGEIERMGRLRRFLPPQVADLIVASGTEKQLESHRREITALFCDLRGFTGFSESADPEDVMTVLREYHEALGASIIKYSGTLERYAGDGVMVVFNDPVPIENPALQAVLMALEMREAIGALTETWRRWGHDIGFGIGIAHGFATLGTIGFEGRFDYAAIGTVSNVASRLCDEAKPGQILISPRVLTKVENAVQVEPVGEFELKGIRRPLAAYNVVGAVSAGA
jgi:GAF domain-containing protein